MIAIALRSLIITNKRRRNEKTKKYSSWRDFKRGVSVEPLSISAYRLAKETHLDQTRISEIIHQKRRITADTALRLAKFFGNSPQFWLGLQNDYDIEEEKINKNAELNKIQQLQVV